MEKLYNEQGEVGVAVSTGWGAGWSTWNNGLSPLDKEFNTLILNEKWEEALTLAEKKGLFSGGLTDCQIEWLPEGTKFKIQEFDGNEALWTLDDLDETA